MKFSLTMVETNLAVLVVAKQRLNFLLLIISTAEEINTENKLPKQGFQCIYGCAEKAFLKDFKSYAITVMRQRDTMVFVHTNENE